MTAKRAVACRLKKNDLFQEILLSKQFMYVYEFLEEEIHAFVAKLDNRCFCWSPIAMLESIQVSTGVASPYKSL